MRLITDYLGRNEDGSWKEIKSVELEEDDRPLILEYLKEHYPEWWYEPLEFPLPPMVTIYLTDPYTEEEHEFDIITSEWNLND